MGFLGKWVKLENSIASEVTQAQKHNYYMFSLLWES